MFLILIFWRNNCDFFEQMLYVRLICFLNSRFLVSNTQKKKNTTFFISIWPLDCNIKVRWSIFEYYLTIVFGQFWYWKSKKVTHQCSWIFMDNFSWNYFNLSNLFPIEELDLELLELLIKEEGFVVNFQVEAHRKEIIKRFQQNITNCIYYKVERSSFLSMSTKKL